jgi:hypothetical protein
MLSTNLPGAITALVDQPDAAIVPEFYLPHQVTQPMVDSSANTAFSKHIINQKQALRNTVRIVSWLLRIKPAS